MSSNQLRILMLGGFEVWRAGQQVRGFESQKVRALLAYLLLEGDRPVSRERLAAVFWGDRDDESARRNLRQALYNLRSTLPDGDGGRPLLCIDSQEVRVDREAGYWLDVDAFESAIGEPDDGGSTAFRDLLAAAQLYRGDFLAGFLLRDCLEFEEWLVAAQERLREKALEAMRTLAASCLGRGEHRLGILHARRLVAMDPLSESAHRQLLRLYHLAGDRGRALAHYAELGALLRRELGVEPLAETRELYEAILSETVRETTRSERAGALGPVVPLAGRREAYERLAECWQGVVDGDCRLTLLAGEEGIGKSRLARSFIDAATAHRAALVLTAACVEQQPPPSFRPLAEAVRPVLRGDLEGALEADGAAAEPRRRLALLLPELRTNAATGAPAASPQRAGDEVAAALADLLRALARPRPPAATAEPVVLLLDDLHWADAATLAALGSLPARLAGARVWILGTCDPGGLADSHPLAQLAARQGDGVVRRVDLERLDSEALGEIAAALVAPDEAPALRELLERATGGLPLSVVAQVLSMWDEGSLEADLGGRWRFLRSLGDWPEAAREDLDRVLLRRTRQLPSSTRRLAALAAVVGQRFDVELLGRAEHELPAVVEAGLQLLLERWLVRLHRGQWSAAGRESSLELWSRGARRGRFEFDHPRIRAVLYAHLSAPRRQLLHRRVAAALEHLHRDDPAAAAEEVAHHALRGADWERAHRHLALAVENALIAGDPAGASACGREARRVLTLLLEQATDADARERCRADAERLESALAGLDA